MHLAAGKPAAAWQAGSYALEMEAVRGDGDNPVGLRLSMAAAAYMLGRHSASVSLLRQAARIGLIQLRGLQGVAQQTAGGVGGGAAQRVATTADEPATSHQNLSAWVKRQLEPPHERHEKPSTEALEAKLGATERYATLPDTERQLLVAMLQHGMIVAYLHLARCFKAQGRQEHWSSALAHAARMCEAGGTNTAHLLPSVMATLNSTANVGGGAPAASIAQSPPSQSAYHHRVASQTHAPLHHSKANVSGQKQPPSRGNSYQHVAARASPMLSTAVGLVQRSAR